MLFRSLYRVERATRLAFKEESGLQYREKQLSEEDEASKGQVWPRRSALKGQKRLAKVDGEDSPVAEASRKCVV